MKGTLRYNVSYSFTRRKPKLIGRLISNTIKARLLSRRILRYVDVCPSIKCNLSCGHCFASSFERPGQQPLSLKEWKEISRQCIRLGCVSFGITGGEPLMHRDLVPLVEQLSPEENLITVNTNGTLLTERMAEALYEAGVDVIQFSMDSSIPEEHDAFRKKGGTYVSLMNSIDIAQANRLKITFVCTVSHQTIRSEGVRGVINFAKKRGYLLILSRATPAGEWLGRKDILLTEADQEYMYNFVRKHAHVRTDMDANFGPYGCSAGTEKIYITPFGDVIPCPFMHISFGNVRKDPVGVIRNRMLRVPRLNCYSHKCHTAEDADFIDTTLTRTFESKSLADWQDCFPVG